MTALLTVSHGTNDPAGQKAIQAFADAVHAEAGADLTAHAFVDVQQPDVAAALSALPSHAHVVVVPLLLSRGYHLGHDIPAAAAPFGERVVVADALGPDPRLAAALRRRLGEAGATPADRIVLAAAGSSDPAGVADGFEAGRLLGVAMGRPVTVGFLSAAEPTLAEVVGASDEPGRSVVASYLLAPGYFQNLARKSADTRVTEPLLGPDRAPDRELIDIALDRYSAALST